MRSELPLIVIVGPTASGKTSLSIAIAKKFDGEVICADSRTIYKGMDIGTAKPSVVEQQGVPHWGLDLVEPSEKFSAAQFQRYAVAKIADIRARGRLPILVGGTGLYVDAVVFDYQFSAEPVHLERRNELLGWTIEALHRYCADNNIPLPENTQNKRYVVRAIEQRGVNHKRKQEPIANTFIVGITTDNTELRTKIGERFEQMFDNGVVEEAMLLGKKYGWSVEAMTGNIYPLAKSYLEGVISREEFKDKFTTLDWRLAKRQRTWLRRNTYIEWRTVAEARTLIVQHLEK